MATPSVSKLLEQGYMITDANTIYAGQPWEIEDPLLSLFNIAFLDLRTAQALCENIRIEKEAQVKRNQLARERIEHSLTRLKRYAYVVATKEFAETMFHTLGIDDEYPLKDEDLVTKLMSTVLPHLDDWDGTPEEISVAIKTEVTDTTNDFADAVRDNVETQAQSQTATTERDKKRDAYEDVLARIRNFLYLMLPDEREDQRLEEYGFEAWGGEDPEPEKLPAVTGLALDFVDPNLRIMWDAVDGAEGYKLMMGNNPTILTTTLYVGPDTSYTFDPPGGHHYFRVWAMKGDELGLPGDAVDIEIEGIAPPPPVNLNIMLDIDNRTKITWESPEGTVYVGCSLYTIDVPNGSPVPPVPAEPLYDELIVYMITLGELPVGMTRYVWVSGEHDGTESDLTGPASVSRI